MLRRFVGHVGRNTVAYIALFVALGGASFAATSKLLPPHSVGTRELKRNAVLSSRVRDFSLLRRDFRRGQLPRGPVGPQGLPGAARAYGVVPALGQFDTSRSRNVLSVNRIAPGVYCVAVAPPATRPPTPLEPTTILSTLAADAHSGGDGPNERSGHEVRMRGRLKHVRRPDADSPRRSSDWKRGRGAYGPAFLVRRPVVAGARRHSPRRFRGLLGRGRFSAFVDLTKRTMVTRYGGVDTSRERYARLEGR
jgi:hypothetical protein